MPGTAWGPRVIPDFELILMVSGKFSYVNCETDKKVMLGEGEILCIPPGECHVFKCEYDSSPHAVIACIHLELHDQGLFLKKDYVLSPLPPLVTDIKGDTAIHELFRNCRNVFEGFGKYRRELLTAMAKELGLRLAEYWEGGSEKKLSPRLRQMTLFLQKNPDKSPARRVLAKKFHITPEYVNALFKKELGISPARFLKRMKIYQSCCLLCEEGLSVKETAEQLGFYDEFHFSKSFKEIMGLSPSGFKGK
ncbi:MAG: helix-turn-helix transcriptional regulator [Victivallales bacterium]|nr:helix-turn-helix transcriptional regulator [Victivallales bacterium]